MVFGDRAGISRRGRLVPIATVGLWTTIVIHLALHLIVPLAIALTCYRDRWRWSFALMMATMLIDLDHLWAHPVYDPSRCSIGFHPMHQALPMAVYLVALAHPKTRLLGIGLCIHIALDAIDCQFTNGVWYTA